MCELGYFHPRGKIVLPNADTIDNLKQTSSKLKKGSFNLNTITKKFKLLPVPEESVEIYCKCWDQNGGFKTYRDRVILDNKKIKVDKEDVDKALSETTLDVNSILLLADRFVTNHQGKPLYYNKEQMQMATKKILNYILLIETDAMDLHKTKQLAFVLNILTERNLHEKVWEGVEEVQVHDMMASLVNATSNLITADRKTPVYANTTSSLSGIKNTIPLDLNGFTWLAKTVDYIIE